MIKKKNSKKLKQKKVVFDKGKPLNLTKKRHNNQRSKLLITLFLIVSIILTLLLGARYIEIKTEKDEFIRKLSNLSNFTCKTFVINNLINSTLFIKEENNTFSINLFLQKDADFINLDFSNVDVSLGKSQNIGKIRDYLSNNRTYLENDAIFASLYSLFLREFQIKVDYLFVVQGNFDITDYNNFFGLSNLIHNRKPAAGMNVYSNICKDSLDDFFESQVNTFTNSDSVVYSKNRKLSEYINFDSVSKEQLRIQIENYTGVGFWGSLISKYFENYGINVVKINSFDTPKETSTIIVDSEGLFDTETTRLINYLFDISSKNFIKEEKESIFADINIQLGTDSVIY